MRFFDNFFAGIPGDSKIRRVDAEWEEESGFGLSLLDEKKLVNKRQIGYIWLFWVLPLIVVILFLGRLFSLQIILGSYYQGLAQENRLRIQEVPAPRGIIFDRNGKALVKNLPSYYLAVRPIDFPIEDDSALKKLSQAIGESPQQLKKTILKNKNHEILFLEENISREQSLLLKEKLQNITGVEVGYQISRQYQTEGALAHLLGYVGKISQKEDEELKNDNLR